MRRKRETDEEREWREDRDSEIIEDLSPYKCGLPECHDDADRPVMIGKSAFPLRWVLLYAQARCAGVSCLYSSGWYADCNTTYNNGYCYAVNSREIDHKLLYAARKYLEERRVARKREPVTA